MAPAGVVFGKIPLGHTTDPRHAATVSATSPVESAGQQPRRFHESSAATTSRHTTRVSMTPRPAPAREGQAGGRHLEPAADQPLVARGVSRPFGMAHVPRNDLSGTVSRPQGWVVQGVDGQAAHGSTAAQTTPQSNRTHTALRRSGGAGPSPGRRSSKPAKASVTGRATRSSASTAARRSAPLSTEPAGRCG